MTKTASKIIMPKHVWDGKSVEKKKNELEKVPTPTGFGIFSNSFFSFSFSVPSQICLGTISLGLVIF